MDKFVVGMGTAWTILGSFLWSLTISGPMPLWLFRGAVTVAFTVMIVGGAFVAAGLVKDFVR